MLAWMCHSGINVSNVPVRRWQMKTGSAAGRGGCRENSVSVLICPSVQLVSRVCHTGRNNRMKISNKQTMCIIVPTTATISSRIHVASVHSSPRSNEWRRGTKTKHILSLKAIKVWNKTSCSCLHLYYHGDRSCKASRHLPGPKNQMWNALSTFVYLHPSVSLSHRHKASDHIFQKGHITSCSQSWIYDKQPQRSCFMFPALHWRRRCRDAGSNFNRT